MRCVGKDGRKRHLCFCLSPSFWRRNPPDSAVRDEEQVIGNDAGEADASFEPVPAELASKNVIT